MPVPQTIEGVAFHNPGIPDHIADMVFSIDNIIAYEGMTCPINNPDEDNDGVLDEDDKCPNTKDEQIIYGCSCKQILDLKPGKDKNNFCSSGIIKVFTKGIGWAKKLFS